jgi:hypothetical protein
MPDRGRPARCVDHGAPRPPSRPPHPSDRGATRDAHGRRVDTAATYRDRVRCSTRARPRHGGRPVQGDDNAEAQRRAGRGLAPRTPRGRVSVRESARARAWLARRVRLPTTPPRQCSLARRRGPRYRRGVLRARAPAYPTPRLPRRPRQPSAAARRCRTPSRARARPEAARAARRLRAPSAPPQRPGPRRTADGRVTAESFPGRADHRAVAEGRARPAAPRSPEQTGR